MANDWTKRYTTGEPWNPNAERVNNGTDAAVAYKRNRLSQSAPPLSGSHLEGLISVQNNSDSDRKEREILGIDGILFSPNVNLPDFKYGPCVTGVKPTAADHTGRFVVCAEPIAQGAIGRAFIFGICAVRVGSADVNADYLDVTNNDYTHLSANPAGSALQIYSSTTADSNGDYWALVKLACPQKGVFPVLVTPTSGSTFSPVFSATYTVNGLDGGDLRDGTSATATLKTPEDRWTSAAAIWGFQTVAAGSPGTAYRDSGGVLHLVRVDQEWPLAKLCGGS